MGYLCSICYTHLRNLPSSISKLLNIEGTTRHVTLTVVISAQVVCWVVCGTKKWVQITERICLIQEMTVPRCHSQEHTHHWEARWHINKHNTTDFMWNLLCQKMKIRHACCQYYKEEKFWNICCMLLSRIDIYHGIWDIYYYIMEKCAEVGTLSKWEIIFLLLSKATM